MVSTHSHPKVAAFINVLATSFQQCFNTQPPEGGCLPHYQIGFLWIVSTHSHPKVAAHFFSHFLQTLDVSTHSHPKVAAQYYGSVRKNVRGFNTQPPEGGCSVEKQSNNKQLVSTHSHPKVAASILFNCFVVVSVFQHTATRRWLLNKIGQLAVKFVFQHTATRRWLQG